MHATASKKPAYDVEKMRHDMAVKGWLFIDLARAADVSHTTVYRFFGGRQTPRVAKKLAAALGRGGSYYLLSAGSSAQAVTR